MILSSPGRMVRGAAGTRRCLVASCGALLLAFGLLVDPAAPAGASRQEQVAATPVDVIADELEIVFAERLTFSLVAASSEPVESATLRYWVDDPQIVDRRIPVLETGDGAEVIALYEESVARGQIPPTAEITWWWSLHHADGRVTETERRTARYLDERIDWQIAGDDEVRVWFEGGSEELAASQEVASTARAAVDWLVDITGRRPEETIEIVTYADQEDLRRALAARGEVYETRLRTLGARVAPSVVVLDVGSGGGGRDLEAVIFHELSHVVLGLHMDRPWADLPAWLDEGFAMYTEGELGGQERQALERALRQDELMSVRSLSSFPGDAERVAQAYGQSRDYVAYLIEEHDPGRFRDLLDALATGELAIDDALDSVYGFDRLEMYQAYRAARGLSPATVPSDTAGAVDEGAEPLADASEDDVGRDAGGASAAAETAPAAREPSNALAAIRLAGGGLVGAGGLALAVIVAIHLGSRSAPADRSSTGMGAHALGRRGDDGHPDVPEGRRDGDAGARGSGEGIGDVDRDGGDGGGGGGGDVHGGDGDGDGGGGGTGPVAQAQGDVFR